VRARFVLIGNQAAFPYRAFQLSWSQAVARALSDEKLVIFYEETEALLQATSAEGMWAVRRESDQTAKCFRDHRV